MVSNNQNRPERAGPSTAPTEQGSYDEKTSRFVERFAAELTEAGVPRMASRVFACLLVSEAGSLTSAELSERLRISPAAVSGAVRYLAQVRLVSRERQPGSRRECYRLLSDTWYEAIGQRDAYVRRWLETFREGAQEFSPDTPAGRRIAETLEFLGFMEAELQGMMERWKERRKQLYAPERSQPPGKQPGGLPTS